MVEMTMLAAPGRRGWSPSARRVLVEIGIDRGVDPVAVSPSARRVLVEIGKAAPLAWFTTVTLREEGVG